MLTVQEEGLCDRPRSLAELAEGSGLDQGGLIEAVGLAAGLERIDIPPVIDAGGDVFDGGVAEVMAIMAGSS